MSLPIQFRPEAQEEYDAAIDWYELQQTGLGADLARKVGDSISRISANPLLHAKAYGDVRKATVKRFPYVVLYQVDPTEILVVSVFHTSRDPNVWKSRI